MIKTRMILLLTLETSSVHPRAVVRLLKTERKSHGLLARLCRRIKLRALYNFRRSGVPFLPGASRPHDVDVAGSAVARDNEIEVDVTDWHDSRSRNTE